MNKKSRLLIVDDGEGDREEVLAHLQEEHQVSLAPPEACLAQLADTSFDLVILSLASPLALTQEIISHLSRVETPPALLALMEQKLAGKVPPLLDAGVADYILLPISDFRLLDHAVNRNLISRARQLAQREKDEKLEALTERLRANLRVLERDQRAGSRVQRNMMPEAPFPVGNVIFNYRIRPSLILSGDFIDYFSLTDGQILFFIADVSGHGASSAFITVLLKNQVRRLHLQHGSGELKDPGEMLNWLNSELLDIRLEHHITMFLGMLDLTGRSLSYANAAHFPGTIIHTEKETRFLQIGGLPLGLSSRAQYENMQVDLPEKFSLVLLSDGVFEVMSERSLQDKENHLLSIVDDGHSDVDSLFTELGLEERQEIPDDIAVFTINASS